MFTPDQKVHSPMVSLVVLFRNRQVISALYAFNQYWSVSKVAFGVDYLDGGSVAAFELNFAGRAPSFDEQADQSQGNDTPNG